MNMNGETATPGSLAPRVRWLIACACLVTLWITYDGLLSMWDMAAFATKRDRFMFTSGVTLTIAAAIAIAFVPGFRVSRFVRVAVLLPVIHLAAIFAAAVLWSLLRDDVSRALGEWDDFGRRVPSPVWLVPGFCALYASAILIKRRHGEWAHAAVMLALCFLLVLGLWLPFLSNLSVETAHHDAYYGWNRTKYEFGPFKFFGWEASRMLLTPRQFVLAAVGPSALVAIGFTLLAFRRPRALTAWRRTIRNLVVVGLIVAVFGALTLSHAGWRLFLESSYLTLTAAVLVIGSLLVLTLATWLRSALAHHRFASLPHHTGTIAREEDAPVARFEITSWLRGPRLAVRSFVVTTPQGELPIHGADLLLPLPKRTTSLDVDQHVDVLEPGDRVVIAGQSRSHDGPFRGLDATDAAMIAGRDARRYRFSDVALVVWRPAVAYLAILVAVALPPLSIFLT